MSDYLSITDELSSVAQSLRRVNDQLYAISTTSVSSQINWAQLPEPVDD